MRKVLITGSSGLVGSALIKHLSQVGYEVGRLLRTDNGQDPHWDIAKKSIDLAHFDTPDAIIHLAGENVGDQRWSKKKKQEIVDSRIQSTQLLADFICDM